MIHIKSIELINAKDVKKNLRCSLPYVFKIAEQGNIPCVRWECPGKGKVRSRSMIRFKTSDVLSFIEKHYTGYP